MKVCLLTPEFLPAWGGVGTYTYNLARGLQDRAEIHVLTGTAPADLDGGLDGVSVHTLTGSHRGTGKVSPVRFQAAVFRHLPRLVETEGIDIVHANHAYMSDFLARRRYRAASVLTVHTTLDTQARGTMDAGAGVPREGLEGTIVRWRFLLQRMERHYLRGTPSMIFVSRWVRERTLRRYGVTPPHSAVVRNAVDLDRFTPSAERRAGDAGPRTVLFAGRLLALKGIETLLRAASRVTVDARLVLAGPGDARPWREMAAGFGLSEDRCRFLGQVPYPEMSHLYRSADLVVIPSFTESCPLVALEAMASGTPLVAANAGGISEIVQDGVTGWLFPPGDADGLAARIELALADPDQLNTVRRRALEWVRAQASIERMARQTYRFYDEVLRGEAS